ncbi:adhesion G protein-coupled receptor A2 [Eurytemora carolleeae]|uniref:adhesion G protein-coupled receptor A2 n=1 Tax=Eurytemora carolleeae TaxID=1294199 RepID=UPI000C794FD3|nr:adhesion G protein-coupled receptor A2 [Eurytemora carolleeae]|eukprot:XP_023340766.1 adhesion G protein-coupled receptor A2-like [Eurytemora affinis]
MSLATFAVFDIYFLGTSYTVHNDDLIEPAELTQLSELATRTEYSTRKESRDRMEYSTRKESRDRTEYSTRKESRDRMEYSTRKESRDRTEYTTRTESRDRTEYTTRTKSRDRTKASLILGSLPTVLRQRREIVAKGGEVERFGIFLSRNNTLVETHLGAEVRLNCRITRDSEYGTISWFKNDTGLLRLLTVGDDTYIADSRLSITRPVLSMNWSLQIVSVVLSDGGLYICQSTTYPPSSIYVTLAVYEAYAEITGGKEKVFKSGSRMQLTCTIRDITRPPSYIFWYHNSRMINYDEERGISVGVSQLHSRTLISQLTLHNLQVEQSGNYTCSPSSVRPDTVSVRVEARGEGQPEPVLNSGGYSEQGQKPSVVSLFIFILQKIFKF